MEPFTVPQFLDVEDKILGPVTTRQFIIMIIGGGLIFIVYKTSDFALFILLAILIAALVLVIGFVKINGQYFHYFLINLIETFRRPGLRVWRKRYNDSELKYYINQPKVSVSTGPVMTNKQIRGSRLSELSLIVDTGGAYSGEESEK
jgi:hypothetical protein